ncbi:MAG: Asp23/Gls24 family envelope stress response protein [Dietzia sp.]
MTVASTEQRGATTIPSSVVARIAEQVASEYSHIGGSAGGVLGLGARRDFDSRPSAECDLYGTVAALRLDVGIAFPVDLAAACRGLREHVRERVERLTGLTVGRLDIEISWLHPASGTRGNLR